MFPRHMVYFQEIKQTFHMLKIGHGFSMFQEMKNSHKLDNYLFIFMFSLHWPPTLQYSL
jgi:hypothetical protein